VGKSPKKSGFKTGDDPKAPYQPSPLRVAVMQAKKGLIGYSPVEQI
jgi:hypothetical protein